MLCQSFCSTISNESAKCIFKINQEIEGERNYENGDVFFLPVSRGTMEISIQHALSFPKHGDEKWRDICFNIKSGNFKIKGVCPVTRNSELSNGK